MKKIAYIRDDVYCIELLERVGVAEYPNDSTSKVKNIENIHNTPKNGAYEVVIGFSDLTLNNI